MSDDTSGSFNRSVCVWIDSFYLFNIQNLLPLPCQTSCPIKSRSCWTHQRVCDVISQWIRARCLLKCRMKWVVHYVTLCMAVSLLPLCERRFFQNCRHFFLFWRRRICLIWMCLSFENRFVAKLVAFTLWWKPKCRSPKPTGRIATLWSACTSRQLLHLNSKNWSQGLFNFFSSLSPLSYIFIQQIVWQSNFGFTVKIRRQSALWTLVGRRISTSVSHWYRKWFVYL